MAGVSFWGGGKYLSMILPSTIGGYNFFTPCSAFFKKKTKTTFLFILGGFEAFYFFWKEGLLKIFASGRLESKISRLRQGVTSKFLPSQTKIFTPQGRKFCLFPYAIFVLEAKIMPDHRQSFNLVPHRRVKNPGPPFDEFSTVQKCPKSPNE